MLAEGSERVNDDAQLSALGFEADYDRKISLWENFALGFTYLSPVVGVYSVFGIGMAAGGPPMIWWYLIAAIGQFFVCLTFCEVVSQFPISGGIYPWCRRLVGRKWAWLGGWIYGWALFTSIAAIAAAAAPFLAPLLGFEASPAVSTGVAIAIVALSTLLNLSGTKTLARVAMIGFVCEIAGALVVGILLLLFHRAQPLSVIIDPVGAGHGQNYATAFMAAALVGLFTCYGFEACGDVAEETPDPGHSIPKAMKSTIYVGMSASVFVCLALILSVKDLAMVVRGDSANPIRDVLFAAFGSLGAKVVVAVVMVSFVSCILSLQAAASRLLHAYARDRMMFGSRWLSHLSPTTRVPARALALSGFVGAAILILGTFFQDVIATIVSFAVIGIYAAFQMVVLGAIFARSRGWRPAGQFSLGRHGWTINIVGLIWGIAAIGVIIWPHSPELPWYQNYAMLLSFAITVGSGLIYMTLGKPYHRSNSPAGDAWLIRD